MTKVKSIISWVLSFVPTLLPVGSKALDTWSTEIIVMAKAPDNRSTRFALAAMILHMDSNTARRSKHFFVNALHKSSANQVAYDFMEGLKAAQKAEDAAKANPPSLTVVPNAQPETTAS